MTDIPSLPPVFQRWQVAPLEAGDELSFEAASGDTPASVWSLDLPADPEAADVQLSLIEAQLQAAQSALESAPGQLQSFVQRVESSQVAEYGFESYTSGAAELTPAESALLSWLEASQPGELSFEAAPGRELERTSALNEFQAAVSTLMSQILLLAKVETRLGEQLIAHSLVSWKGDTDTSWGQALLAEQRSLHLRSLALAVRSRLVLLKMFVTAAQGAAKIAALVAAPGGALLALPAAWKYLNALISLTAETHRA